MSVVPLNTTHLQEDDCHKKDANQLRKLRKKIFKLTNQRKQQIDQIKRSSILKHIPLNQKAQKIIEGSKFVQQNPVPQSGLKQRMDIQNSNQKGGGSEKETKGTENQGICNYWKKVLVSQYEQSLKPHDLEYLEYLKSISVKDYSNQKVSIVFSFRSGHNLINEGKYEKIILKDEQGEPIQYGGESIPNYHKIKSGFCKIIFSPTHDIKRLHAINQLFQILCTELIPHSLSYYLETRVKQIPAIFPDQKVQADCNKETTYNKTITY